MWSRWQMRKQKGRQTAPFGPPELVSAELFDHVTKQLCVAWQFLGLGQRLGYPGLVDEIAPRNIVVGAVTTPRPAAQGERLTHAIPQIATVGGGLWLVHHDTRRLGGVGEFHDVLIAVRVDATGVTLALIRLDVVGQFDRVVDVLCVIQRHHDR